MCIYDKPMKRNVNKLLIQIMQTKKQTTYK